jgi:hypothetical protein
MMLPNGQMGGLVGLKSPVWALLRVRQRAPTDLNDRRICSGIAAPHSLPYPSLVDVI